MKIQRFFVMLPIVCSTEPITIPSSELLNQLKNVLRLSPGDNVILFDNSGYQFICAIHSYQSDSVSFNILEKQENSVKSPRETYLFASIVKKDNFEWIVEKATELGVSHIIPVISDRTEKKGLNIERLTKVSIEASEQSGRGIVPELHDILKLADAIANYSHLPSIAWEPTAEKFERGELENIQGIYIGPEGGWTEKELELFKEKGIKIRSLGPQILRAETAVIAALSQVVF